MMRSTSFIEYKELHSPAPSGIVYRKACQLHLHGNLPRDLTLQRQCGAELQSGKRFIRFWGTGGSGDSVFAKEISHYSAFSLLILQNFEKIYVFYSFVMNSLSFVFMYHCMNP